MKILEEASNLYFGWLYLSSEPVHPHVVVIVIDTLRRYCRGSGYPNLDALAKKGQRLNKAQHQAYTASVISFSGQSVMQHGWDHKMPKDMPKGVSYPAFEVERTLAEEIEEKRISNDWFLRIVC